MNETSKQRIEFIDLAKGLCILLVVSWHVDTNNLLYCNDTIENFFKAFRMPLYFILSGVFLSIKGIYFNFFQKKINKIIIPFIFFVTLTNIFFWIGKDLLGGYEKGWFSGEFQWMSPLIFCYEEFPSTFNNQPIWFLPCLFNAYMIYMLIDKLAKDKIITKLTLTIIISLSAYILSQQKINLPFYIDSAMAATLYLLIGEMLRKNSSLLVKNKYDNYNILFSVFCFTLLYIILFITKGNSYYIFGYINGFIGALGILLFAKHFKHIPVISYIGRYSIIMLGVHGPMIGVFKRIFSSVTPNLYVSEGLTFIAIIISAIIAIAIFTRYLPWFVAQKDLVYFKPNINFFQ